MRKSSRAVQRAFGDTVPLGIDIFRGDSWQLFVTDPSKAVRIGLFMRADFKAAWGKGKNDTRIAIGVGRIDFIPANRISEGDGEAFRRSGSALEHMKKSNCMHISLDDEDMERFVNVILQLIDTLAMRWTDKQAQAVTGALQGLTQEKIAVSWKPRIKQQTVNRHLDRAGWNGIENALMLIENSLIKL